MGVDKPVPVVKSPGEELSAILDVVGMSAKEIALRTGVSERYIDTVIHGTREISYAFAKRLECSLGVPAAEWMEMKIRYDRYRFTLKERESIQPEEAEAVERLRPVLPFLRNHGLLRETKDETEEILELRSFMGVSDLRSMQDIIHVIYRFRLKDCGVDPYIVFAWQQMCERLTRGAKNLPPFNPQKLKDSFPAIKHLMFYEESEIPFHLKKALSACGVAFRLVRRFDGVPIKGFHRRVREGCVRLCIAALEMRQDLFWQGLFRAIGHIIKGDAIFIDFDGKETEDPIADNFADELLLPMGRYKLLTDQKDLSMEVIRRFAESQIIPEHIVLGRLLRDGLLEETDEVLARLPKYTWAHI